jgi:hypothetical protein
MAKITGQISCPTMTYDTSFSFAGQQNNFILQGYFIIYWSPFQKLMHSFPFLVKDPRN